MVKKELRTNYSCDLHSHSTCSDGTDTPKELIDRASELGIRVLVLCDHDVVPKDALRLDNHRCNVYKYAVSKDIYFIPGIEISCETYVEDVHIVCMGCNWKDSFFSDFERKVQKSKQENYKILIKRLHEDGYPITWEKVLTWQGRIIPPEDIQKKRIFEILGDIGFASDWAEAKKRVKATPRYQIPRAKPATVDVIREIHRTGGIAILAHPHLIAETLTLDGKTMTRDAFIETLIHAGLDGIEARYTYNKTSYIGSHSMEEIADEINKKYSKRLKIISGGSDYHGKTKQNQKKFRELGETGLTWDEFYQNPYLQKIIEVLYGQIIP